VKKYIYPAIIVPLLAFLISGCTCFKGYGKIRLQSGPGKKVTIRELEDNWHDYNIYYAGYYGGLSIKHPSAVMFDPKNDNRALVGERWTKVQDQKTFSRLISSIQSQKARYYPRLWRILGPDDQFYGYLFSAWRQVPVVIKVLDDKTMFVYDLPMPPYLECPDLKYHLVSGKFQGTAR